MPGVLRHRHSCISTCLLTYITTRMCHKHATTSYSASSETLLKPSSSYNTYTVVFASCTVVYNKYCPSESTYCDNDTSYHILSFRTLITSNNAKWKKPYKNKSSFFSKHIVTDNTL